MDFINIVKGLPSQNGFNVFIMESDKNLQKVLADAEIAKNIYLLTPVEAIELALIKNNLNKVLDFTDVDKKKIDDWINKV